MSAAAGMSRGVSIHAVDVAAGVPAAGMIVELQRLSPDPARIASGPIAADGHWRPEDRSVTEALPQGLYEATFHVGAWLGERGVTSFLDTVPFRFRLGAGHCHLPLKFTPWGYALFRGA